MDSDRKKLSEIEEEETELLFKDMLPTGWMSFYLIWIEIGKM